MCKRFRTALLSIATLLATVLASGNPAHAAVSSADTTVGSVPLGNARYVVPADALYVATNGRDTNPGTLSAPLATIGAAVAKAIDGRTIVVRRGLYHESVDVGTGHQVTIENYPGEAVWLDGSAPVTGWTQSGSTWVHSGWNTFFDSTAGYSANSAATGTWIDPNYPMAAHPDQVWVGSTWLKQVASAAQVTRGTFFVDQPNHRLIIGNAPTPGVLASTLSTALTIHSNGSVVRGIGVRRYATSLPQLGTLRIWGNSDRLENVILSENATQALTTHGLGVTLNHVTAQFNGFIGIHATQADGLVMNGLLVRSNNREHFNASSPSQGGVKVTQTRHVTFTDNEVRDNAGMNGVWFDQSSYDITVTGNRIVNNGRMGLYTELSSLITVADNYIVDNGMDQYRIFDANKVTAWNNTFGGGTSRLVEMVQDTRRASDTSLPGHDLRQPLPDPTVTWILGDIVFKDNVFGSGTQFHIYVMDKSAQRSASQMNITIDGNIFSPQPAHYADIAWGNADGLTYTKLITAADVNAGPVNGTHNIDSPTAETVSQLVSSSLTVTAGNALPLPATVAAKVGEPAGIKHLGCF